MINWMLVDDSADEAAAFSGDLTLADRIAVTPSTAKNAEAALASGQLDVDGVLMDVDLSNETGMRNTGPGMAQNIRVAQQRQEIRSFPVIRFSYRARVLQSVPAWMDPFYAALGPALRARDDPRLDKDDLARLGPLARRLQA